ncbi:glycylpeptide N-tetradecanoyltransferase 1 [Yasminevirus sp. GU-2018]|uniref:glycylpeptide N-tetradecanoyltransferase n=1 Tax=Yasminevirus sp. GU-2018 TaxID=2420051 RepID=A0A5K0U950_9VIRU|nr:glycylpeptide N-tetradecanoyltransferase 1 [Yasminevirus sp. GU-2018]
MSRSYIEAKTHQSKYWKGKPVMKLSDRATTVREIKKDTDMEKFKRPTETNLPTGYTWGVIDVCDSEKMQVVCDLLNQHYRRGSESEYIVKYDPDRISWEMCHKGYFLTVNDQSGNPVGVIGFTYRTLQLEEQRYSVVEPMYMCCEKKYRGTGIAKVLMDETVRRSTLTGINKGVFCTNVIVSKPIATIRQYSRPLNYKKLREHDFIDIAGVDDDDAHAKTKINLKPNKKYVVAKKTDENVNIVYDLYKKFMSTFNVSAVLTKIEVENYMFDEKYVKTLLVYDEEGDKPVDFITYNFYDIIDTNKTAGEDNVIKVANILMYSSNCVRPDLLMINVLKQISYDKIHIVYLNDMMHSNEAILSNVKNGDEDTDDDERGAAYDMNLIRTRRKTFLNLFNIESGVYKQTMVSWLIF